ncbi:hypothetical protein [Shinella sp. JR1-6]|uniref:hypothetical protein n=1 Tax=Shinella sp. JR1-6 TaxID=2527671 RepID=UPI00102D4511|nr:hypothetical protein [Shinella sp. JR1-6]TAA53909.1 hypothetical protein EXZ48_28065 [Shinella sp. JR1-6]
MWGNSYEQGKHTGYNDGTMGGMFGKREYDIAQAQKESHLERHLRLEKEKQEQEKRERELAQKNAQNNDSHKVICTELHRQGLMSRADYALGADYAREHLTERHYRGYHAWAIAVVRHMRRSKRATAFWRILAQARADHIAYLYGDTARRNRFGALLCAVGYPACYLIGGLIGARDWQTLYEQDAAQTSKHS